MTYDEALMLLNDMEFANKYQGKEEYTNMLILCKQALEKVKHLEEENDEMRSALRKFCFHTLCSQCPFNEDDNKWFCKLSKFFEEEE